MGLGSQKNDPYQGMSPIDALKLSTELSNQRETTLLERTKNKEQNLYDALSIVPVVGNAIAGYEAGKAGGQAYQDFSEGDNVSGAINTGMAGLNTLGAVLGLPVGKAAKAAAKDASRRTNVFVPADDDPWAEAAQTMYENLPKNYSRPDKANKAVFRDLDLFYGPDGRLRKEISDADMRTTAARFRAGDEAPLEDVISHPELFNAMPDLRGTPVRFTDERANNGARIARMTPEGGYEMSAGGQPVFNRMQLAKLNQYNIADQAGFTPASRIGADSKMEDIDAAIANVRQAMDDEIVPPGSAQAYLDSLIKHKKLATQALIGKPGSSKLLKEAGFDNDYMPTPFDRKKAAKDYLYRKNAGNQEVTTVKDRHKKKGGYPYDGVPLADTLVLPPRGVIGADLADFLTNWRTYGAGRALGKKR